MLFLQATRRSLHKENSSLDTSQSLLESSLFSKKPFYIIQDYLFWINFRSEGT